MYYVVVGQGEPPLSCSTKTSTPALSSLFHVCAKLFQRSDLNDDSVCSRMLKCAVAFGFRIAAEMGRPDHRYMSGGSQVKSRLGGCCVGYCADSVIAVPAVLTITEGVFPMNCGN